MPEQTLTCIDCGQPFTFTDSEQEFYLSKKLSTPQRCKPCRAGRKEHRVSNDREMYDAVCAQCGTPTKLPFRPRSVSEGGKPVLCLSCFAATRHETT
jgi:CxxC-x17-CxxC domain-containing protein